MAKVQSSFKNMILTLVSVTLVSGILLGAVHKMTEDPIAKAQKEKQESAIRLVAPQYDNDPIKEQYQKDCADGTVATVFPAMKGGEKVGAAVQASTNSGFGGEIQIMVGFDKEGNVLEYTVLSHNETPGLGSKMGEWFHAQGSIIGKNPAKDKFTVSKDGGDVDAITAATISSRAFLAAVRNAFEAFGGVDANSGATVNEQ